MSVPACPLWQDFVAALETAAGVPQANTSSVQPPLPQRADAAVRKLRMQGDGALRNAVAKSLGLHKHQKAPPQTQALARIWFPLTITTNYDSLYADAFESTWSERGRGFRIKREIQVRGRSAGDCQDVLRSLRSPSEPLLWAIQGYLGDWILADDSAENPANQLVVGHHDYRRVTHRDSHFRKAFAEVFRSRSLLFLGSSLAEPYILELFSEVLEFYGTNPQYHFAFVKRDEGNADFLRTRFNIDVLEYDDYSDLPVWIDQLAAALNAANAGVRSRQYTLAAPLPKPSPAVSSRSASGTTPDRAPAIRYQIAATDLEIVYGALTLPEESTACTAVSAGMSLLGQRYLSAAIRDLVQEGLIRYADFSMVPLAKTGPSVDRFGMSPLYCVVTRNDTGERDLRIIGMAMEILCDRADADGFTVVQTQLFAVGQGAAFPGPYSLVTMIRAFAGWRRAHPASTLRLSLHVIDTDVRLDIDSGRIDVLELLSCEEVRFWVEVRFDGQEAERHIEYRAIDTTLGEIAERFHASGPLWQADVIPSPTRRQNVINLDASSLKLTLADLGIVPGSTLRFSR